MQDRPDHRVFQALTGLRGITIASLLVSHFGTIILVLLPATEPFVWMLRNNIAFRMDLFFILNGFMLAYVYFRRQESFSWRAHREFLWARLTRIYPTHLAMLLILLGGVIIAGRLHINLEGKYAMSAILPHLLLMHTWPFLIWARPEWNYPSWFLSSLWFGYVFLFPCVWALSSRVKKTRWLVLWLFCPLFLRLSLGPFFVLQGINPLLRACCDLLAGCALYLIYSNQRALFAAAQKHVDKLALAGLLALLMPLVLSLAGAWLWVNSLLILAIPFLIAGLTADNSMTARFMMLRPVMWLGRLAYALFISHTVVQKVLKVALPAERYSGSSLLVRCLVLAAYTAAVLAFAAAVHRLVELPCLTALRRSSRKRSEQAYELALPVTQPRWESKDPAAS